MVGKWFLVCTALPFPDYFIRRFQDLSLYCTIMKLPAVCLGVLDLTGTMVAPKNDENVCVGSG